MPTYSKNIWIGLSTPGDWSVAADWDVASVPESSDDVYLTNSSQDVTAGLDQHLITPASLNITKSYTGGIGSSTTYLQIGPAICNIGLDDPTGTGAGSGRINLNFGSSAVVVNIYSSASSATDAGQQPIRLIGSAITAVNVYGGKVAIAPLYSETATVTTINCIGANAQVYLGVGVTATTINVSGGTLNNYSAIASTTLNVSGGTMNNYCSATTTTVNVKRQGVYYHNGTGTVTTLNVSGTASYAKDPRAKTITNINLYNGGNLDLNNGVPLGITLTNGIDLENTEIGAVSLSLGSNYKISLAAVT